MLCRPLGQLLAVSVFVFRELRSLIQGKQLRRSNPYLKQEIAYQLGAVCQLKQFSLISPILILGWVIAGCAGGEPTPTPAPGETPPLQPSAQAAIPTTVTSVPSTAPAAALPPDGLVLDPTPVHTQPPIDPQADCVAPTAGAGIGSVEDMVSGHRFDSAPDTYALKVRVETTSLWTSVEVTGVQSTTSGYAIVRGEGEINVDIEGLHVYDLSRPEGGPYQNQNVVLEINAIVQKEDDTAVFQIRKGDSGTTVYTLFSGNGDSTEEIARFTNGGTDNRQNLNTFLLDLEALPPPISFPAAEERYRGPLFDAHAHLVGTQDREHNAAEDNRVHINPETAGKLFATLDRENIIGLIGFLPVEHEDFVGNDGFNRPYQEQTLAVVNRCDNKLIPFLHPQTLIDIPPKTASHKLLTLIDRNYKGNPIPFRGIGEIHSGGLLTDSYADMRLVDPAMLELYDYAATNDLIVMIHPELSDIEDLHGALRHNINTIFLLHGLVDSVETIAEELETLFREHKNVYFSIDANLIPGYGLHNSQVRNKEHFLANLHSQPMYYRLLASALVYFKPLIEAHPTRMMWGADLIYSWNFEPDVIHELAQFARDFIAGLDPEVLERYAYRNAMEMLGLSPNRGD